jgi:nucleotide-binding universal stress UspA family protein
MSSTPPALTDAHPPEVDARPKGLERIAVGVDDRAEARDAAYLATMIAAATGAELTLVAVVLDPPAAIRPKMHRAAVREHASMLLRELRDLLAPGARTLIETDWSVPRALARVAQREHQDLLVVGSTHRGDQGRVRIGTQSRQLLGAAKCALAIAPRGLCAAGKRPPINVGVGYDRAREGAEALRVAATMARAAGTRLRVCAVVDDRLPYAVSTSVGPEIQGMWDELIEPDVESLREDTKRAASATGAEVAVEVKPGSPPDELVALSREVDLLVIGSRRWGPAARPWLGRTGEHLMHHAHCSLMVVPRPSTGRP